MTTETQQQPEADAVPREGDILAGKYRIDKVLGQGGMGVVVAAEHVTLRQKVAVKFLLPAAMQREDAPGRFLREARAAVAIQSEHVARVMDVGSLETGAPYMVMELLSGVDLGVLLQQRGPLPVDEAVDFVLQACEAIAEAHSLGIIHRDLKPANLFLTQRADGSSLVKVLDFGLAKPTKASTLDASLTAANVIMGSPFYMSPEQIRSLKGLDTRTDLWSLGIILYQLLTGARPFESDALGSLFLMIGADPPPPMRERRPDLPPELEAAILKCLEKDPAQRTQTVAELARLIAPFGKEDSRISVERIHRVLADATPLVRQGSIGNGRTTSSLNLAEAARAATPEMAATVAQPAGAAGGSGVSSGSMAALASPVDAVRPSAPSAAAPAPAPRSAGKAVLFALAAAVALAVAGFFVLRPHGQPGVAASATSAPTAAGAAPATVAPTAAGDAPTATAATTAAPAPTAVPAASASADASATPTATATAAVTAEPAPAKPGKSKGAPPPHAPRKSKDPLERWGK